MQFRQDSSETFWKYFERFKDLLTQCPYHNIKKWRQCQILYDGLDYQTKTLFETICQGGFLQKYENQGCELFENLAEKMIQWESCPKKSRNQNPTSFKSALHSIESSVSAEAKIAHLMRMLELLEVKEPVSINQVSPPKSQLPVALIANHESRL